MDARVRPLADIFALNTDLVANCVADLDSGQANRRLPGGGNSIAFLVAHLADARYHLLEALGASAPNPLTESLGAARSIDDVKNMPSFGAILSAFRGASARLANALDGLKASDLQRQTTQRFPIDGGTLVDTIAFLAQHESYHVGQMAFIRRQMGLPPMSYQRSGS
ncbi:MAG: DinB family protein [Gemmatimonadota bacterium]